MEAYQITLNKMPAKFTYKSTLALVNKMIELQKELPAIHVGFLVVELEDKPKYDKKCKCGRQSKVKGLCIACYQRNIRYSRPVPDNFKETFNSVLLKVKDGIPIYKACKIVGIEKTFFYGCISESQKNELAINKALYSKKKSQTF
jgi:hypothetical protein